MLNDFLIIARSAGEDRNAKQIANMIIRSKVQINGTIFRLIWKINLAHYLYRHDHEIPWKYIISTLVHI